MGTSETGSQVLPPAWRFTNREQRSRCVSSHPQSPGGFSYTISSAGAWELKLRDTCQSLVSFPLSLWEILHALNLGILAILSLLHLLASAHYLLFPQAPHSPVMLIRDSTKILFNVSFLKNVGQNNLYGYPFVHRINVYLFGFVLGAWPHKKSLLKYVHKPKISQWMQLCIRSVTGLSTF